jgi:hypothetical protein
VDITSAGTNARVTGCSFTAPTSEAIRTASTGAQIDNNYNCKVLETGSADTNVYYDIDPSSTIIGASSVTHNSYVSSSSTTPQIDYDQASTGDCAIRQRLGAGNSYAFGIDNSDSDKWKLSYGSTGNAALGTNDLIAVTTAGIVTLTNQLYAPDGAVGTPAWSWTNATSSGFFRAASNDFRFAIAGASVFQFTISAASQGAFSILGTSALLGLHTDIVLARDAAGALAQRNGANAQTLRVYNTFTSSTSYERGKLEWSSNVLNIGTEKGSGGGTARNMTFQTDGTSAFTLDTNQILFPAGTLATTMTKFFINIPGAAGVPSGTPATTTGFPLYWDSTNLQLYVYTGGAWKKSAVFT